MISITLPRSEFDTLSAIDVGQGRPMVFLHGVGLKAEVWEPQIEAFRKSYNVIAPDMPGHGQSLCPNTPATLADYANAYLPLLKSLKEPAFVVGHSMGSMIALELARLAPKSIGAIAALNTVFERSPQAAIAVQTRAAKLDGITTPDPTSTLARWFGKTGSPERTTCEAFLRETDPKGYKLAYSAFAYSNSPDRETLRTLTCPVLFVTGALEPNSTPGMSHAMAGLTPKGQALILERAAHMMPMTHADEVNTALADFAQEFWQ